MALAISRQKTTADIDDRRWQLVLAHSPSKDFFYAVISTKIFCRPCCPSRRPRRANVCFFETKEAAIAAGYRACKRCKPDSSEDTNADSSARQTVEAACEYIRSVNGETKLADVANHVNLSPRYFHGLFKQITGVTPGVYSSRIRQQSQAPHNAAPAVADTPMSDMATNDSFSPGSELLVTPSMQSPLIDDFMLSFYGSADAYAELDGIDGGDPSAWQNVIAFEPGNLMSLDASVCPLTGLSNKPGTQFDLPPLVNAFEPLPTTDLDGFTPPAVDLATDVQQKPTFLNTTQA